jgi:hypothetical protein
LNEAWDDLETKDRDADEEEWLTLTRYPMSLCQIRMVEDGIGLRQRIPPQCRLAGGYEDSIFCELAC